VGNLSTVTSEVRQDHVELNTLFEAHLKPALDEIQLEQRQFGQARQELEQKIDRISERMDETETRMNRRGQVLAEPEIQATKNQEYHDSFVKFLRNGTLPIEYRVTDNYNEDTPPGTQGGYLVIPEWASNIYKRVHELTPMRQVAEVINVSSNLFQIPAESEQDYVATWVGEQQARPVTDSPELRMVNIAIKEMYAQPRATQNILEDNAYNLERWVTESLATRFAQRQGEAFISGDGVLAPFGVLNPGGGGFANPLFQAVPTQNVWPPAPDAPVPSTNDLIDLQFYIKQEYSNNASWFMHRSFIAQIRKLRGDDGVLIWQPGIQAGDPNLILGRPYYESPDMVSPAVINGAIANGENVDGAPFIAYGDWRRAYTIADRIGLYTRRDDLTDKPYVLFYTRMRVGANVKDYNAYATLTIRTV
jgi:HK97 family phage major capsid protein